MVIIIIFTNNSCFTGTNCFKRKTLFSLKHTSSSWLDLAPSFRRHGRPSPAFPERSARLPGRRGTLWPLHWYQWHPATEVCHTPTQPQPVRGGAWAAVGASREEGEKGEGQPPGTCDGKERRPQEQQRGPVGQLGRPAGSQPLQWRSAARHQPIQLQLQNQVLRHFISVWIVKKKIKGCNVTAVQPFIMVLWALCLYTFLNDFTFT